MFDTLKKEITKTPDQLNSVQLEQATGMAKKLTELRKFLYLFFSAGAGMAFFGVSVLVGVNWLVQIIIIILLIPYVMFKIRDYIRGTI